MADKRIQCNERMTGAGHPTLPDTLNRLATVEHNTDGTHDLTKVAPASKGVTNGDSHDHVGGDGAAISLTSAVTGVLSVANGGTGSSTQNFVDLTTNQTIAGNKTLTGQTTIAAGTAAAPSLTFAGGTDTGVFSAGAGSVAVTTNGTKRVEAIGTGEVGIGAAPTVGQGALQVTGSQALTGNLNFTGTGNRITGDFNNATLANRVAFQNSMVNGATNIMAIPNGASTQSTLILKNNVDPANCANAVLLATATETILQSSITGTATLNPMSFRMATTNHCMLSTNGNFIIKSSAVKTDDDGVNKLQVSGGILERGAGLIGYGTGSGGTVTQATSKGTSVTLNKPTGRITTTADALAAGDSAQFFLVSTLIGQYDTIIVNHTSGASKYGVRADQVFTGGCVITIKNLTAGVLSEAIIINFAIIKGAIA